MNYFYFPTLSFISMLLFIVILSLKLANEFSVIRSTSYHTNLSKSEMDQKHQMVWNWNIWHNINHLNQWYLPTFQSICFCNYVIDRMGSVEFDVFSYYNILRFGAKVDWYLRYIFARVQLIEPLRLRLILYSISNVNNF